MSDIKKLLEGLQAEGVSVEVSSLAKYMASNGVMVVPTVGRRRGYVSLNERAYGISLAEMSEEGSAFYKGRVSQGHLNFIPPEDEAMLGTLEKRLRRAVERRTLCDGFLPIAAYDSLKQEFERIRVAYFDKRDEILDKWPLLVNEFTAGAKEMLEGITMPEHQRTLVLQDFISEIPSVTEYKTSFKMGLRVRAFPAECAQEGLSSSVAAAVQDTWQDDVMTTAITAIEALIGSMWAKSITAMAQYLKGGTIKTQTLESLARLVNELSWKNVFRNKLLTRLEQLLKPILSVSDSKAAEMVEEAIFTIYKYAKESKIDLDMDKCPYERAHLEAVSNITRKEA